MSDNISTNDVWVTQNKYINRLSIQKMSMETLMDTVIRELRERTKKHAGSKRVGLEKEVFAKYIDTYPNIWGINRGGHPETQEYKAATVTHAKNNDYVPEHFEHGVADMTLPQLMEMVCDIVISAKEQSWSVNELRSYIRSDFADRYEIPKPILDIICNSVSELMEKC